MKYILSLLMLILFSTSSWSACSDDLCENVRITHIELTTSGWLAIKTSGDERNLSCIAWFDHITVPKENEHFRFLYAMILSSYTTQEPVTIKMTTETNGGNVCDVESIILKK